LSASNNAFHGDGSIAIGSISNADAQFGTWRGVNLAAADQTDHTGNNVYLVGPTLYGDSYMTGTVDITDLTVLSNNFGQSGVGWQGGDWFGTGTVDITDLTALSANYGKTMPWYGDYSSGATAVLPPPSAGIASASPSAVPEPAAAMLLLVATMGIGSVRWLRRKRS
jgi:hypothetical protein